MCDQVEYHPYLDQTKVREACARHGMAVVAYSPVAKGRIKSDETLARIGQAHGKTAAQVCLRWLVQQNVSAIPRTSRIERLSENIDIFDFALSDERDAADLPDGERQRPAHRFRFRAEMGLRPVASAAMLAEGDYRNLDQVTMKPGQIIRTGITASAIAHLSVLAVGAVLHRGASVRFGHGRADHGRYCFAGRGPATAEEGRAASGAENAAFRRLRPVFESRDRRVRRHRAASS